MRDQFMPPLDGPPLPVLGRVEEESRDREPSYEDALRAGAPKPPPVSPPHNVRLCTRSLISYQTSTGSMTIPMHSRSFSALHRRGS